MSSCITVLLHCVVATLAIYFLIRNTVYPKSYPKAAVKLFLVHLGIVKSDTEGAVCATVIWPFSRYYGCYNGTMNEGATRKDIDEVIDIMKDFMGQVSNQFAEVDKR